MKSGQNQIIFDFTRGKAIPQSPNSSDSL